MKFIPKFVVSIIQDIFFDFNTYWLVLPELDILYESGMI